MKPTTREERIRAYIKGTRSQEEKANFEQELRSDPSLAEDLALARSEMAAAELLIAQETRQLFRKWQPAPRSIWSKRIIIWGLVIAGALLLIYVGAGYWKSQTPVPTSQPEKQVAPTPVPPPKPTEPIAQVNPETNSPAPATRSNYLALAEKQLPDPMLSQLRSTTAGSAQSLLGQAQQAYTSGKYQQTLELLAQTDSTQLQSAGYLKAHTLFRLKRFAEAEQQFQQPGR
ncbi:MAG: hypothetical protein IPL65_05390 [Lewinellaceae bacterium]|nr:hypothetical protein [Lewinellaceae bacterium]